MKRLASAFLVAALSLTNIPSLQAQNDVNRDRTSLVEGNNRFAFELYQRLASEEGNVFFSPYSISSALGMTYAGARNQTAEQMAKTLHFDLVNQRLHPAFSALQKQLNQKREHPNFELSVANSLWGQKNFGFKGDFLNLTNEYYDAGLNQVDFRNQAEAARKTINAWVEEKTNDRIKDLIPMGSVTPLTRLVLTNAIYFKAPWNTEFAKALTKKADFTLASGKKVSVPTMNHTLKTSYVKTDDMQMVELPYRGHELSMLVLLPNDVNGLANLEKSLSQKQLDDWLQMRKRYQVTTYLPKWNFTSQFKLSKVLQTMGMTDAFSKENADFTGMSSEEQLNIDEVIHKAFVEVNEKGTEAAAATAVLVFGTTSVAPQQLPRVTFRADHPFLFVIRHNQSGSILFMGRVSNPGE